MRKAVVPVHRIDSDGTIGIKIPDGTWFIEGGKLTKADIKRMSDVNQLSFHIDPIEHMIHVVKSIGIEVED